MYRAARPPSLLPSWRRRYGRLRAPLIGLVRTAGSLATVFLVRMYVHLLRLSMAWVPWLSRSCVCRVPLLPRSGLSPWLRWR